MSYRCLGTTLPIFVALLLYSDAAPLGEAGRWFRLRQAQQRLGPRPKSFNDGAGRFGDSEGGRLTGPSLYPINVILLGPEAAHPGGQASLDRVRRGGWRL